MVSKEQLLREYVRGVLKEEGDGGGDGGFGDYGGYGGGMYGFEFGSQKDLYNVFIRPFTDVVQTAVGKTKEMSLQAQKLIRVGFETIATTLIPVLSDDYKEIFDGYSERLDKVDEEYKEVYDANWTALKDNDITLAAFLYYPTAFVTQFAVRKAPIPVMNTLDALTGGRFTEYFDKVADILDLGEERKPLERTGGYGLATKDKWSSKGGYGGYGGMGGYGGGWGGDGGFGGDGGGGEAAWHPGPLLYEKKDDKKKGEKKEKVDVAALIMKPEIMDAVASSPITQRVHKEMQAIVRETLETVYDKAQGIAGATNLQELQKLVGKEIPEINKIAQLPPEQRQVGEKQVLSSVKQAAKKMAMQGLVNHVKMAVQSGVPQDHPYLADFKATINKIKAL